MWALVIGKYGYQFSSLAKKGYEVFLSNLCKAQEDRKNLASMLNHKHLFAGDDYEYRFGGTRILDEQIHSAYLKGIPNVMQKLEQGDAEIKLCVVELFAITTHQNSPVLISIQFQTELWNLLHATPESADGVPTGPQV